MYNVSYLKLTEKKESLNFRNTTKVKMRYQSPDMIHIVTATRKGIPISYFQDYINNKINFVITLFYMG